MNTKVFKRLMVVTCVIIDSFCSWTVVTDMAVEVLNCEDFGNFLEAEGLHEDIVSTFVGNRICGQVFLALTEDDLKELVPVIGDRVRVREVLQRERKVNIILQGVNADLFFYLPYAECTIVFFSFTCRFKTQLKKDVA